MAAVAVIDVASGRIEALAGALSPCARQEVDGPGRDKACDPRLPYPVQYRPDALLNPAVFHDAMPASTIKPIMAAAFLSDPEVGARWLARRAGGDEARRRRPTRDSLRGQLMRSDSARFLDRMFCSEKAYADCRRPWQVQAMASAFGWNAGCADARSDCGKRDLLSGATLGTRRRIASADALTTPVAFGRLMSEPLAGKAGAAMHLMKPMALDAGIVRRCAAGADGRRLSDDDWEKCRGGAVVDIVAEGWGQGHARASALGIAGMMATLAAAANGQREVAPPHLVDAVRGVASRQVDAAHAVAAAWHPAPAVAHGLSPEAAAVILSGLSYSHRNGTARTACEQVFDAKRCRDIDWLAGKTGTPSFPNDGISLDELARLCPKGAEATLAARSGACSSLRPYKWYVAAWRDPASPRPLDQGDRGAHRAQLAAPERPGARRRRPRPQPLGRDRDADRRPPRRPHLGSRAMTASTRARGTSTCARRTTAASACGRCRRARPARSDLPEPLVWTFDGPFERCLADLEDTLRRAHRHGRRRVARRPADRSLAAGAAAPRRRRRCAAARLGALPGTPRGLRPAVAAAGAPPDERRPAGDARHRLSQLTPVFESSHHVAQELDPPRCAPDERAGGARRPARPRADLDAPSSPAPSAGAPPPRAERGKRVAAREPTLASAEHLGAYAPLIDAIRDELEHFVASHVRLHLAIAERDRFLLTAVGIGCEAVRRGARACCSSSCASSSRSRSSATSRAR